MAGTRVVSHPNRGSNHTLMLNRLLEFSLRQRAAVLLATGVLVAVGVGSALRLPLDAVPDITNPQVQINTAVAALAPEEIEKQVTFPIENEMSGRSEERRV